MSRPFAVFDIDGTLLRWQLYHAVADALVTQGDLDKEAFTMVHDARMRWKRREPGFSFQDYEHTLVTVIDQSITGIAPAAVDTAIRQVIAEYKDQVYTYPRDLIRDLQAQNYLLFAISASQAEIVGQLAAHYGFDDFGGSHYPVQDGQFTGEKDVLRSHRKPEYLKELVAKHGARWQGSIGVGDSESDIPMLETVEQPIAFNPTRDLFEHARTHQWQIVLERKNMVYRLEANNGQYVLAQANAG